MLKTYTYIRHATLKETGNKVYETSFDAWGRERNPITWDYSTSPYTKPAWLIRGFTGHEMLPEFNLINMNGRMYDPILGRMLSPDNYVQDATGTQGYNRYSYVWNNPLKYTDPTGEIVWAPIIVGAMIGSFTGFTIAGISGVRSPEKLFLGAGIGAVSGAAGGLSGGAVASTIGTVGFTGGALSGAAGGATSGFISGAGNAWAFQGASFDEGLVVGLKIGGIGAAVGGVTGGIIGGFSAKKSGLDFWSGDKVMDADVFNQLFNDGVACIDCGFNQGESLSSFKADLSGSDDYQQLFKAYKKAHFYSKIGRNVSLNDVIDYSTFDNATGWKNQGGYYFLKEYKFGSDGYLKMIVAGKNHSGKIISSVSISDLDKSSIVLWHSSMPRDRSISKLMFSNPSYMHKVWQYIIK